MLMLGVQAPAEEAAKRGSTWTSSSSSGKLRQGLAQQQCRKKRKHVDKDGRYKLLDCTGMDVKLLAAQAEFGRKIGVRAGQAAVGLDQHVC
ncbi:MAG: hypothetical protein FRX49_04303 [Trebouxia sp. A1-2]|nr:MAG: hypothetical protein FRX49_04303 [Trebouxia sp. A1-2]